jgi:hypothetical protein
MEIAKLVADVEAAAQIAEIIKEAGGLTRWDTLEILHGRAGQGDERARELFHKLHKAMSFVGTSADDDDDLDQLDRVQSNRGYIS